MAKVGEVLIRVHSINDKVHTVSPKVSIREVARILKEKNVGALPVVAEGVLVGIISERDLAREVVGYDVNSYTAKVESYMTPNPITVNSDDDLLDCMDIMKKNKIRHLPVIDDNHLVGIISISDILEILNDELKNVNENFLRFIYGNQPLIS